ncbi:MAG: ABC transporter permease [Eubacteriales bacterium]|nr:ABC transporter permease [Eubacteriales bacterium]
MIKKLRCTWHIACNMLLGKLIKNFLLLLLLIATCLLIGISLLVINFKYFDAMEIRKLCDAERTGRITLDWDVDADFSLEDAAKWFRKVEEIEYIEGIGNFVDCGIEEVDPVIARMQEGHHYTSLYDGTDLIEDTVMNRGMLDVFDLQWESRANAPVEGIILGWQYREKFQDQEVLHCAEGDIPILGFTCRGSRWLSHEVAGRSMPEITALVDTGYMCFDLYDDSEEDPSDQRWFRLRNADDYEKFTAEVERLAQEQGIMARVYPMTEYIRLEAERNEKIFAELIRYAQGAMGVIILFLVLIKLYSFWRNKRQYGVFYSSGMTGRKIIASIWMENCALFYTALLIAYIILWNSFAVLARIGHGSYGALEGIVQTLLRGRVFAEEFMIISVCCIVTSVIPAFVFNRIPPLSMVKDFYE